MVEVQTQPNVDLDIAGMDFHGPVAELLRHVEALREASAALDEPLAKIEIRAGIEVVTERRAILGAQVLSNLVLPVDVVGDHDVGADAVGDERDVDARVRPEEPIPMWADLGTEIQPEIVLVRLLLDAQAGLDIQELVCLGEHVDQLDAGRAGNEIAEPRNGEAGTEAAPV